LLYRNDDEALRVYIGHVEHRADVVPTEQLFLLSARPPDLINRVPRGQGDTPGVAPGTAALTRSPVLIY